MNEYGIEWARPRILQTSSGLRSLQSGPPTDAFWVDWRSNKEGMKSKGFGLSKVGTNWIVQHWSIPSPSPEEVPAPAAKIPVNFSPAGLLPYQVRPAQALAFSLSTHLAAMDGSDTGIGKTYQDLAAFRAIGVSPLVVCPKVVKENWRRVARHMGMEIEVINYEKIRTGGTAYGKWQTETIHGREFERFVWAPEVKGLLFDEAHRCKGPKTQNASLMIGARFQDIPTIAASATAATSPMDMRALGFLLGLHGLKNFYQWAEAHGCHRNRWDGWEFGGSNTDIQRIHAEVFPDHGQRVRVRDLGDAFPATRITTTMVDVMAPGSLDKAYAAIEAAKDTIHEKAKKDKDGAEHLTALLRARQISELGKIPAMIELARDSIAEGRSVFVAVNFQESVDVIYEEFLKHHIVGKIDGSTPDEMRTQYIDAFQNNTSRLIVANIRAGGIGIGLHDLDGDHPRTAIISPSWSPVDLKQALGRVWRSGGKSGSVQHLVYARGTVEERVAAGLQIKLDRMTVLNDGLSELDIKESDL